MLAMMNKPVPISRDVEAEGVHCPIRLVMVDPRACEPCRFLSDATYNGVGTITSLVCTPSIGDMLRDV
jgi:hypothetical protein